MFNGPNLNLLGTREPELYGAVTLADVERLCSEEATTLGYAADCRQTNAEGQLVDWIHEAGQRFSAGDSVGAVINPGAYAHTSVAVRDAVAGTGLRVIEVHLTNVHARERFRRHSYLSAVARGVIVGMGVTGYPLAIRGLVYLAESTDTRS